MEFNRTKTAVLDAIQANISVMLEGSPGIGKSDLVREIAKERGGKVYDIRLSLLNPIDLRGLPVIDREAGQSKWLPPVFLPKQSYDESGSAILSKDVLFLDEITSAPKSVQACAYQLILDRKVGEYQVPDGVAIVAAGNLATDNAVVYRMPAPLRNRFLRVTLEPDLESWKDWAINKGDIDMTVISYLNFRNDSLFKFNQKTDPDSFPTPRSWAMLSKLVKIWKGKVSKKHSEITGLVGKGCASEYISFVKLMPDLPKIKEVLDGKSPKFPTDVSTAYAFSGCISSNTILACKKGKTEDIQQVGNVIKYAMNKMSAEFAVLTIKDIIRSKEFKKVTKYCLKLPEMREFVSKYHEVIVEN